MRLLKTVLLVLLILSVVSFGEEAEANSKTYNLDVKYMQDVYSNPKNRYETANYLPINIESNNSSLTISANNWNVASWYVRTVYDESFSSYRTYSSSQNVVDWLNEGRDYNNRLYSGLALYSSSLGLISNICEFYPQYNNGSIILGSGQNTFVGLSPNTKYYLGTSRCIAWGSFIYYPTQFVNSLDARSTEYENRSYLYVPNITLEHAMYIPVYTTAATPIISFTDIKDTRITVSWVDNNAPGTSYTLQRRLPNQAWQNIYTGSIKTYTDTELDNETLYQYRIRVNHIAGEDWYIYTTIGEVSTTSNPAVAAAQEAASQAKAAKEAAEDTVQYSLDAKTAAMASESKATEAVEEVKALSATITPIIHSIKGLNGATATQNGIFSIVVSASNASQFRAGVNGVYTDWQESPQISVTLPDKGVYTIEVQAIRVEGAPATSGYITVFRL